MLKEALNIECNLRTVVELVWFDDTASGNFDLAIGAIVSTLLDPSDYFNAWYGKAGRRTIRSGTTRNSRRWSTRSTSSSTREAAGPDPQGRGDHGAGPAAPADRVGEDQRGLVQLRQGASTAADYFGVYDVVRQDTVWLDKA